MHHAALVRSLQALANFNTVFQHLLGREWPPRQPVSQRLPFQKFHHQVVDAILMADIMQSANVGMVQSRYGAGFAIETLSGLGIVRQVAGQDFDRHRAVQACVLRSIHLAHAARTDRRKNLVRAETNSGGKGHEC